MSNNSTVAMRRFHRREQSLGEEIANAVSHGVGAVAAIPVLVVNAVLDAVSCAARGIRGSGFPTAIFRPRWQWLAAAIALTRALPQSGPGWERLAAAMVLTRALPQRVARPAQGELPAARSCGHLRAHCRHLHAVRAGYFQGCLGLDHVSRSLGSDWRRRRSGAEVSGRRTSSNGVVRAVSGHGLAGAGGMPISPGLLTLHLRYRPANRTHPGP
jgi:hypothetical protein